MEIIWKLAIWVFILSPSYSLGENQTFLQKEKIKDLAYGVVEVVVPKLESKDIQYEKPLPFDQLSFNLREDKFHSIGTAFFISKKELISAAHVFAPEYHSLYNGKFFVRDSKGKTYKVQKILGYSSYSDLIQFSLTSYPKKITPIEHSKNVEVGDTVFSVGNAFGEGISFRAGQVSSFTSERNNGKWKDIRFSSPASPGNSGGPLLNGKAQYVGVIQRKTKNENLNFAVPSSIVIKMSKTEASLYRKGVGLKESDISEASTVATWDEKIKIPMELGKFAQKSQKLFGKFYSKLIKKHYKKFGKLLFPENTKYREYLRDQVFINKFGNVKSISNGNSWTVANYKGQEMNLGEGQKLNYAKSDMADIELFLDKPKDISLKKFINSPERIIKDLAKGIPLQRKMAGQKIRMTQLGSPEKNEVWQDKLGRRWNTLIWSLPSQDSFLGIHCSPMPSGVSCLLDIKRNASFTLGYQELLKINVNNMPRGLKGSVKQWAEFFSLPKDYLSHHMRKVKYDYKKDLVQIQTSHWDYNPNGNAILISH